LSRAQGMLSRQTPRRTDGEDNERSSTKGEECGGRAAEGGAGGHAGGRRGLRRFGEIGRGEKRQSGCYIVPKIGNDHRRSGSGDEGWLHAGDGDLLGYRNCLREVG